MQTCISNETVLATRQEVFFTKAASRTKHNGHCNIGFLINAALLNVYFILHCHLDLYFNEYDIRMSCIL